MTKNAKETKSGPGSLPDGLEAKIKEWREIVEWLTPAKDREMELRKEIASTLFHKPEEGTNRLKAGAFEFVLTSKINRTLDEAALDSVMAELPEDSPYRQVGVLIRYKPALVLDGYRAMPEDQKLIFAQALTEEAGAPGLIINDLSPAMDPATSPATPDWPATPTAPEASPAPEEEKPKAKRGRKKKEA